MAMSDNKYELTEQEREYCERYLALGSQSAAYREAFDVPEGTSVNRKAQALHNTKRIQNYLIAKVEAITEENPKVMKPEEILEFWSEIARGNVQDQFGLEASLSDRMKASENLARRYGLTREIVEVKSSGGLAEQMEQARKRALMNSD